jgi:preprotein translocase subunit SecE
MQKFLQYLKDVRQEMSKVSWPNREEIVGGTALVIILSVAISVVVKVFDLALSKALGLFLNM